MCCYLPQKQKQEDANYRFDDPTVGHGYNSAILFGASQRLIAVSLLDGFSVFAIATIATLLGRYR